MPLKQTTDTPAVRTEKNRDHSVDNLKGFLIILVILGHGGLLTSFKTPIADFLQGYIYLFHMPLFFALSSLFVKEFSWQFVAKRFVQLMIPFYFFVIIDPVHVIFELIHPGFSTLPVLFNFGINPVIKQVFIGSAFYLQNALWFLPALFVANVLLSLLVKYRDNKIIVGVFIVVFFTVLFFSPVIQTKHYIIPYDMDVAVYITPLLLLLRYLYLNKTNLLTYNPLIFATGIVLSSTLIVCIVPKKPASALTGRLDLAQFFVPGTLWGYLLICLLSVFILLLFLNFQHAGILSKIGLYTLPIFIFHAYPWFRYFESLQPLEFLLINVVSSIVIGIGLSKLLMKISPKFSWIGMVA